MSTLAWMERLGFDTSKLGFTLRTALAACCAVVLAWLAGFEHPQWSGMTVWAASQPMRGQLLEKSLFRVQGTILGALFGTGLLALSQGPGWTLISGLALWIGLCAWAGNVMRGFASYGVMLAGYSAAMVALLHSRQADNPFAVGLDRLLTVLLGVLVALAVGWFFARKGSYDRSAFLVRRQGRQILEALADRLVGGTVWDERQAQRLLAEMAGVEESLDAQGAGSLRSRAAVRALRRQLSAQVSLLLWQRRLSDEQRSAALVSALREAAAAFGDDFEPGLAGAALRRAAEVAHDGMLQEVLSSMARAVESGGSAGQQGIQAASQEGTFLADTALHRDWQGGREAGVRALLAIFLAGAVWLLTGWDAGPFMLLGAAIMTTIFSTAENPVRLLRQVLLGQTLGVLGALVCRWLVWPHMDSSAGLVFSMLPFIIAGGFFMAHKRGGGPLGFDCSMILLLLLQPDWPLPEGGFLHSLQYAGAVILGPMLGLLAFILVYPVDGQRRRRTLQTAMSHEIETMAARRGVSSRRSGWRGRLSHRVLALARWGDKAGGSRAAAMADGYAGILLGAAVMHIDEVLQQGQLPPVAARRLAAVQIRLQHLGSAPDRAVQALLRSADSLARVPGVDAVLLRDSAAALVESGLMQAGEG